MIYPNVFEQKVGFDKVREHLSEACQSSLGRGRVEDMAFMSRAEDVRRTVRLVTEFMEVLKEDALPEQHFFDVRDALKRARIENTYLQVQEMFDLQRSLNTIIQYASLLSRSEGEDGSVGHSEPVYKYPNLHELTKEVVLYPHIVKRIGQILDPLGNVKDSASPALATIRRELAQTAGSISRILHNIMRTAKSEGLVDKDVAPTMRDGRLVIPVAPALKRKISGIVHDESDTGRTVYIEPAEVVEANNRIRELEAEERQEIKRILLDFTATIRPEINNILFGYEFLADIDFIMAKAKYAAKTNAAEPRISDEPHIDWSLAVHPLLQMKLAMEWKKVVPLEIKLDKRNRILLISGPNAGGKSVCLKTVGLLQYMLQCGLLVPMAKSSIAGIFRSIFIDIGDEQSIDDDLSTYSSHLNNMKNMLRHANSQSLILIDEFGGGTEPQIGGAIAEAVLKRFNRHEVFGVITTHYQNLKLLAQNTEGIINGAMLYDRQQMQPLFQLQIGNAGSSFAVEIARKIGLPEDVIADASEIVGKDYINSDKYLQDIVRDKRYWEQKRQVIHTQEKQLDQAIQRYEQEVETLRGQRREIIAKAKSDAADLLQRSNARIEQTVREIKEAQAEKERTRTIRQQHQDFKEEVSSIDETAMDERIERQMEKIKRRKERRQNKADNTETSTAASQPKAQPTSKAETPQDPTAAPTLVAGDYVRLKGTNTPGLIRKLNGKEAQVEFGSVITNVRIDRLEKTTKPKAEKRAATFISAYTQDEIRKKTLRFSQDIDVRGMRGNEALQAITSYVDDALVANVASVRILHGTGNGILKSLIRQYLATVPEIVDFHDEHIQLGGAGITVVEF